MSHHSHTQIFGRTLEQIVWPEPTTLKEALTAPEAGEWRKAMEKELESLKSNEVWTLTDLPQGKKIMGSKWVYKRKTRVDGSITRYKLQNVQTTLSPNPSGSLVERSERLGPNAGLSSSFEFPL